MPHWWKLIVPLGLALAVTGFGSPAASDDTAPDPDVPSMFSTSEARDAMEKTTLVKLQITVGNRRIVDGSR